MLVGCLGQMQLFHAGDRLLVGSDALAGEYLAANIDHRLDIQQCTEQCAAFADAPAALKELQRVRTAQSTIRGDHRLDRRGDLVE